MSQEQIMKIRSEINQLTDRIHAAQITAGDALSLLTRHLREKQEKLDELQALYNFNQVSVENHTPAMIEPIPTEKNLIQILWQEKAKQS